MREGGYISYQSHPAFCSLCRAIGEESFEGSPDIPPLEAEELVGGVLEGLARPVAEQQDVEEVPEGGVVPPGHLVVADLLELGRGHPDRLPLVPAFPEDLEQLVLGRDRPRDGEVLVGGLVGR